MLPRRDARLLPALKLEVERIVAEAGFDPSHFQWREETPGDMMGEGRYVDLFVYRERVAKREQYLAYFESDGPSTFTVVLNPGMITRNERFEQQNWSAVASMVKRWASDIRRQAEAAAMLEAIDKLRAASRSSGVVVDVPKFASVVRSAQTIPADAPLPAEAVAKVADLVALASVLGSRFDKLEANADSRDSKADERHRQVMSELSTLQTQLAAFQKESGRLGAKDFINQGISLVMSLVLTAYVGPQQAQQIIPMLLDLLSQLAPAPKT